MHYPRLILPLAAAITMTGCVSQSKYNEMVAERDALQQSNRDLNVEIDMQAQTIADMKSHQMDLADEMEELITAGLIEMELLAHGLDLTLAQDVLFTSGSATLKPEGRQLIADLVDEIKESPYQLLVVGHTDSVPVGENLVGQFPTNWELAAARACNVVRVMEEEGVPGVQLGAISAGDQRPVASNDTAEGRAKNRRIQIKIRPVVQDDYLFDRR